MSAQRIEKFQTSRISMENSTKPFMT